VVATPSQDAAAPEAASEAVRCAWAGSDALMLAYHDEEWGVPLHDDPALFQLLTLEGAQAGLSWQTVLNKREAYRKAFDGFDAGKIARYTPKHVEKLLQNASIIRNRAKVESTIGNAKAFLATQEEFGSFAAYVWRFVDGTVRKNRFRSMAAIPANTPQSDAMSKELKRRGFKFIGSTICYAFMQSAGLVNDHTTDCFRYGEV